MAVLALGVGVLLGAAWLRGAEYDEFYTIFLAMGTARPVWPEGVLTVADAWGRLAGHSELAGIAIDLRGTDVHPPLYFWISAAWRAIVGTSLFATRTLSVLCGVAALGLVGSIARRIHVPAIPAMLLTLGCYGFVYTGAIARGFALAQLLTLAGMWVMLATRAWWGGLPVGLLLGAACLTNYLAVFVAGAILLCALLRRWRVGIAAIAGFAALLPPVLWFFLAQRASRTGQFPPFELVPALARLGQYAAANVFGGLPLYAGTARTSLAAALALSLAGLATLAIHRWWRRPYAGLLGLCVLAPPLGLLGLGILFNNTPIELRYLAFSTPFVGLLLAGALPRPLLALVLAVQTASIAGLMTRPETMQPHAAATRAAAALAGTNGVVLVPRGNDGVGLIGAVLQSAPPDMRMAIIASGQNPAAAARAHPQAVLLLLEPDAESRATAAAMRTTFATNPCWRETASAANLRAYEHICRE